MMKNSEGVIVIGAGGHGRVILDLLHVLELAERSVIVDANPTLRGSRILGIPVDGGDDRIPHLLAEGFRKFVVAIGGVGLSSLRRKLFNQAQRFGLNPFLLRHPSSCCSRFAHLGDSSQILAAVVVSAEAEIGENCILNTGAIIEHNCVLGSDVHVAPGARLMGNVKVGCQVHVGAGATVCENLTIGDRAVVGAGAVVVRNVPTNAVVVGVPAREIRRNET